MTTYVLTVDVHDLEPIGPVPASAEVRLWRALPDASGPQVVSTRQQAITVGAGPTTVTLTSGVAYWAEFTGVQGWETPFLFSGTTDTSIAERWRNGQVDPATLQPTTTVPPVAATLAGLQAQIDALTSGVAAGATLLVGTGIDPTGATDSYAAVQAILTAAIDGTTVTVPDGATIRINGQLTIPNRIRFGGTGILNLYGLTGSGHSAGITVNADNTILDRLNIGNPSMAIGDPAQGNGVSQYGILIKANNVLVVGCWVDKFQSGIQVDSHGEYEGTQILYNRVTDVLGSGGGPTDSTTHNGEDRGDGICTWGARATIYGNLVACRTGSDARIGIHAEALPDQETTTTAHADSMVTIGGNIVTGQFRRGIVSEEVKRVAIVGNSIADPTWWGAAIISGRDCLISGNTIYYTRTSTDNQGSIWGPHHAGIMVYSSIEGVLGTVITGNTIDVAAGASITSGIVFDGTGTYSPAHINPTVEGNSIRDESGTMVTGVRFVRASLGAKVTGNVVPLFQQYGVYVQSGSEISITANKLTGPGAAVTGAKAIHFNGSTTDWQLNGNTIADVETGINCVNGGNVQVNSNSFTRCATGINGFGTVAPFVLVGNLFSSTVTTARQSVTANAVQAGNSN